MFTTAGKVTQNDDICKAKFQRKYIIDGKTIEDRRSLLCKLTPESVFVIIRIAILGKCPRKIPLWNFPEQINIMTEKNLIPSYSTFNLLQRHINSFNMKLFWSNFIIFILLAFPTSIEPQSFKITKSNGFPLFSLMNTPFYDNSEHAVFQIQLNFTKIHHSSIALISDIRKEIDLIAKKTKSAKNVLSARRNLNYSVRVKNFMTFVYKKATNLEKAEKRNIIGAILGGHHFY